MSILFAVRDRIRTINNLYKVTSAMELVTQTKINKIRQNSVHAKAYQENFRKLFTPVAVAHDAENPIQPGKEMIANKRHCLVGFLSQKGFCGNFNDKVLGKMLIRLAPLSMHTNVDVHCVGRKTSKISYVIKRPINNILAPERTYRDDFAPYVETCVASICSGIPMEIYFIYNEFVTILQQNPVVKQIYPIVPYLKKRDHYKKRCSMSRI